MLQVHAKSNGFNRLFSTPKGILESSLVVSYRGPWKQLKAAHQVHWVATKYRMRAVSELIKHALGKVSTPPQKHSSIYLALSGGVDSSVSALILREAGWRVKPVLMRCWDSDQDEGGTNCFDGELRAAELTVEKLGLEPLQVFDFVKEYWTDVFENVFLGGIRRGFIPNADLACNRWVKFGAFPERVAERGDENTPIATGHYAMVQHTKAGTRLLAARDEVKDQSYFLASVQEEALRRVVLPVGDLLKTEVVSIASDAGLPAAQAKSSRGICFVGKRSMSEFIEQYIDLKDEGRFVDVDSGDVLGDVRNGYALTVGQRARIAGLAEARFVVGRRGKDIIVASHEHECLKTSGVWCDTADWIGKEPQCIAGGVEKEVGFKACSTMRMGKAWVKRERGGWSVRFDEERRKVGRGQAVVVYDGRECLGALWPVCEHDEHEALR